MSALYTGNTAEFGEELALGEANGYLAPLTVDDLNLEAAAMAAWNDGVPTPGMAWELIPEGQRQRVRRMARAAVAAALGQTTTKEN